MDPSEFEQKKVTCRSRRSQRAATVPLNLNGVLTTPLTVNVLKSAVTMRLRNEVVLVALEE